MHAALVWNGGAGSAGDLAADDVAARLGDALGGEVRVFACGDGADPVTCARAALDAGAELIVAAGGDGTASAVAGVVAGSRARLGVLPLGTANSFAGGLGIPPDLDGALAVLGAGATRVVDVARVTCGDDRRVMILHCMIGLHADVVGSASRASKQRWGLLAYAAQAVRELTELEPFEVALEVGDRVIRCQAVDVAIANVAPLKTVLAQGPGRIEPDDGLVDVTIVAAGSVSEAVAAGLHLWRTARDGQAATRDQIGYLPVRAVRVDATPPQAVLVDGERVGETPVAVEVLAGALTVVAPPAVRNADEPDGPKPVKLAGLPRLAIERDPD